MRLIKGKRDFTDQIVADSLIDQDKVTVSQAEEALEFVRKVKRRGHPYLGEVLVECGFLKVNTLQKHLNKRERILLNFCSNLCESGFLTKEQYQDIIDLKLKFPEKNISDIIASSGHISRDVFYKLLSRTHKMPYLGETLIKEGEITKDILLKALDIQRAKNVAEYLFSRHFISVSDMKKIEQTFYSNKRH